MDEFNILNELNKIIKRIKEEEDNTIKAFTMYIGGLLIKNGIKPILTKVEMPYEECFNKIEYQIVSRYGYMFERFDTAEHDRMIINKYRDKVKEDVSARLKARKHYLTDDEYEHEVEATRNMISALDYFAEKMKRGAE